MKDIILRELKNYVERKLREIKAEVEGIEDQVVEGDDLNELLLRMVPIKQERGR